MVKNEERNVERLFKSVASWIDGYVLCDTGSTDGTVALAKRLIKESGKPGQVFEYPWVNFGVSRTRSFECFQEWVTKSSGWDASTVYALLLDGDMVLPDEGGLHARLAACGPHYTGAQIPQRNGGLQYQNTRLLRASATWTCVGATHEYWSNGSGQTLQLESPVITDIGDGGCKADKYTRDARLLEEDLKKDSNNVRTHFYLGQTYMSLGRHRDALAALQKRIDLGGWEEERYIAHVYRGECFQHLGETDSMVCEWLKAWQLRQHRTEAALKLIQHYRKTPNMGFVAYMFIEKLIQIQLGETVEGHKLWDAATHKDILFVSHRDMVVPIWEELGICAFYAGRKEAGRYRMDKMTLCADLNFHERNRMAELYGWYQWHLPVRKRVQLALPTAADTGIQWLDDGFWRPFNPSVRREGSRYLVNLRVGNYETTDAKHFVYRGLHNTIITRNIVQLLDKDLAPVSTPEKPFEVVVPPQYYANRNTNIHGIEDCRWLGPNAFIATSRQVVNSDLNKMVRVDFDWKTKKVMRMKPLAAPIEREENDYQKNWLPFTWKGEELYVYKLNPFTICSFKSGVKVQWTAPAHVTLDGLRGSAPPVAWSSAKHPEERLVLVGHFCHYGATARRYYHRFITLKEDLTPSRVGRLFTLCGENIQYIAGMAEGIEPGTYVATYGVNDSQAWAIEIDADAIEKTLDYTV